MTMGGSLSQAIQQIQLPIQVVQPDQAEILHQVCETLAVLVMFHIDYAQAEVQWKSLARKALAYVARQLAALSSSSTSVGAAASATQSSSSSAAAVPISAVRALLDELISSRQP